MKNEDTAYLEDLIYGIIGIFWFTVGGALLIGALVGAIAVLLMSF